ncbi:N-acetyltransferase [Rhodobacteraceae bacterium N5(2021)]|uniref:N-acetyltransferase n=1 Tax=Gymnodinialimonas phycosphaerae TaxID=2841589 RepID=A0A975YEI6_9RHOB|nr:N-acetyltransferase [Gymnodinialimonas phycosphaerae]MBY4893658.1 N-acetyltransferase [Gymnodinialimonas phycosphaerae]
MPEPYDIRPEVRRDHVAIDAVHNAAFGSDADIPALVRDLRAADAPFPTLSVVATHDGTAVGHVMASHAWLDGPRELIDVLVLSPLGVHPAHQRKGLGTALIAAVLRAAEGKGAPMVLLEGSPGYYGARGFEPASAQDIRRPSLRIPSPAFQVATLPAYTPDMTGTFIYRDVHWRHGVGLYKTS